MKGWCEAIALVWFVFYLTCWAMLPWLACMACVKYLFN